MKEQKILLIHTALFIITVITTTIAGAEWMYGRWLFIDEYSLTQEELWNGLSFSIPFLLILTVHEMGHFTSGQNESDQGDPALLYSHVAGFYPWYALLWYHGGIHSY